MLLIYLIFIFGITMIFIYNKNSENSFKLTIQLGLVAVIGTLLTVWWYLLDEIPYGKYIPIAVKTILQAFYKYTIGSETFLGIALRFWGGITIGIVFAFLIIGGVYSAIQLQRKRSKFKRYQLSEKERLNKLHENSLRHKKETVDTPASQDEATFVDMNTQIDKGLVDTKLNAEEVANSSDLLTTYPYVSNGEWLLSNDENIDFINRKFGKNYKGFGDIQLYDMKGEAQWN